MTISGKIKMRPVKCPDFLWHIQRCNGELTKLRERAQYTPDEYCQPLADVVFSPTTIPFAKT